MILWMKYQSYSVQITELFTRGRHGNFSVMYLTQNSLHKSQRALSLNSDYMVIFQNPRDNSQFPTIAREIRPDKVKFLMRTYKDATSSPHKYLMLDLNQTLRKSFQ